jgi:hypothetical protein
MSDARSDVRVQRDIVLVQAMRNTIMVASVLVSASLLAAMAFVGATHSLASQEFRLVRYVVGALALFAVAFASVALVLLSRASRDYDPATIETHWRAAHRYVMISAASLIVFTFGALWIAL